jgi:predicted ATPase
LPDQAMGVAESSIAEALATNHAMSVGQALAMACPIALLTCDLDAAERYVEILLDHSTRHALARWRAWALSHQGVLAIQRGEFRVGLRLLRASSAEPSAIEVRQFFPFLTAEALSRAGQIADALAVIEEAIGSSERGRRWATAEMLRIKGEVFLLQGAPEAAAAAEDHFRKALDLARRQGALAWQLRAATSLARLLCGQNRSTDAKALLQPVFDSFS